MHKAKPQPRPGRRLEASIERTFKQLNVMPNIFAMRLSPEFKRGAKVYTSAQPCDYFIRTATHAIFFDAKECGEPVWYLSHAQPAQVEGMEKLDRLGCTCGFLIWFYHQEYSNLRWLSPVAGHFPTKAVWAELPVWDWQKILEQERKSLPC